MKIGYLVKKRDSCYWIRVLIPTPHIVELGNEVREELLEQVALCDGCRDKGIQERTFFEEGEWKCVGCKKPFSENISEWQNKVMDLIEWADVIVFQRPTSLDHLRMMKMIKEDVKKPVVMESDDEYIKVPEWNTGYQYYKPRKDIIKEMLTTANALTVTTPSLRDSYLEYNKNIHVIKNALDIELIDVTPPANDFVVMKRGKRYTHQNPETDRIPSAEFLEARKGKKFIGWGGSPTHEKDLEIVIPAIKRIVNQEEDVIFGFVGYIHRSFFEIIPVDRLFCFSLVPMAQYFSLYKAIFREGDIGIAPVVDLPFNWAKSCLKVIEYNALNILPVASRSVTYSDAINRGYEAQNLDWDWNSKLRYAINCPDEEKMERLDSNRKFLEENYSILKVAHDWDRFFKCGVNP